jgi:hypothetical protein
MRATAYRLAAARDLTASTFKLYSQLALNDKMNTAYRLVLTKAKAPLAATTRNVHEKRLNTDLAMLANTMVAYAERVKPQYRSLTGLPKSTPKYKLSTADRTLLEKQEASLSNDLNMAVVRAVQLGEAQAKQREQRIMSRLSRGEEAFEEIVSEKVERRVDHYFKLIGPKRERIGQNYLSLKAYIAAGGEGLVKYFSGLSSGSNNLQILSLGDLVRSVAARSTAKVHVASGLGMGVKTMPGVFTSKVYRVVHRSTSQHGLVNEYVHIMTGLRERWRFGLGRYLLGKVEAAMLMKGILSVGKAGKLNGNQVYMSGKAIGLTAQIDELEELAVPQGRYARKLSYYAALLSVKRPAETKKGYKVPPPVWDGK